MHVDKVHVFANLPNHLAMADLFSPFSRHNNASVLSSMLRLFSFFWLAIVNAHSYSYSHHCHSVTEEMHSVLAAAAAQSLSQR